MEKSTLAPEPWEKKDTITIRNYHKESIVCRRAEIVRKTHHLMKGLMFREKLDYSHGMLMVFPEEGFHSIWMFGMRFPIDLVFISRHKLVVDTHEYFLPMGWNPKTWKVFRPRKAAKYVLEINAGEIEKRNVAAGDLLEFS